MVAMRLHINQLDYFMHRSSPRFYSFVLTFVQLYSHRPVIYCNTRPCPLQLIYTAITTPTTPSPSDRDTLQPDLVVLPPPHRDVRISFNNCGLGRGHFTSRQNPYPYPSIDTSDYFFKRRHSNALHNVDGHISAVPIRRIARWTNPSTGRNDRGYMLETRPNGRPTVLQELRALPISES
jgi:hypothetical protein